MEKLIKDGKVAVLYSPGWGAGFYSWGAPTEAIFDPKLINLVWEGNIQPVIEYVENVYPEASTNGCEDLTVTWIPVGMKFRIEEHDGSEYIVTEEDLKLIA